MPWGEGWRDPERQQPLAYLCRLFFRFLLWFREDLDIFRSLEETSSESAERQVAAEGLDLSHRWERSGRAGPGGYPLSGGSGRRFRCDRAADGTHRQPLPPARRGPSPGPSTGPDLGADSAPGGSRQTVPAREGSGPGQGSHCPLSPLESFAGAAVVPLLKCRSRRAQRNRRKMGKLQPAPRGWAPADACPSPGIRDLSAETAVGRWKNWGLQSYQGKKKKISREELVSVRCPPALPEVSGPRGVKGRGLPPLSQRSSRVTEPGPAFRCVALWPRRLGLAQHNGTIPARGAPPTARRRAAGGGGGHRPDKAPRRTAPAAPGRRLGYVPGAARRCLSLQEDPRQPESGACGQSCGRLLPSRKGMPSKPEFLCNDLGPPGPRDGRSTGAPRIPGPGAPGRAITPLPLPQTVPPARPSPLPREWNEIAFPPQGLRPPTGEPAARGGRRGWRGATGSLEAGDVPTWAGRLTAVQLPGGPSQGLQMNALGVGEHLQEGRLGVEARDAAGPQQPHAHTAHSGGAEYGAGRQQVPGLQRVEGSPRVRRWLLIQAQDLLDAEASAARRGGPRTGLSACRGGQWRGQWRRRRGGGGRAVGLGLPGQAGSQRRARFARHVVASGPRCPLRECLGATGSGPFYTPSWEP